MFFLEHSVDHFIFDSFLKNVLMNVCSSFNRKLAGARLRPRVVTVHSRHMYRV